MSALSDALAAMDKATKGPWVIDYGYSDWGMPKTNLILNSAGDLEKPIAEIPSVTPYCMGASQKDIDTSRKAWANTRIIAAAPNMAAWIEKALPWVEIRAERLRTLLILARAEKDEAYAELIADASEELAALDALLAEAKGDGK